jgi:Peptidase of plants and bacteria
MISMIAKPSAFTLLDDRDLSDWFATIYYEIKSVLDAQDLPFDSVTLVWKDQISNGHNLLGLYINISIDYITEFSTDKAKRLVETKGVICHEFARAFVNHQAPNVPNYVVTGIADYVRLKLGLAPSHWTREEDWTAGYCSTAKFFEYLEAINSGFITKFYNLICRENYSEEFYCRLTGTSVERLHCKYSGYSYDYITWNESDYETTCLVINKSNSTVFATAITHPAYNTDPAKAPAATLREILIESLKMLYPVKKHPKLLKLTLYIKDMEGLRVH